MLCYAMLCYAINTHPPTNPCYARTQGIEVARRDNCPLVVKIQEKALRLLFETRDISQVLITYLTHTHIYISYITHTHIYIFHT